MIEYYQLTKKDLLYENYNNLKIKFPNEFIYMPDTYTSVNMDQFKKLHNNYKISKNDLWLIKPNFLQGGAGIRFLENITQIKKNDIVTKYISNPLLINGRKFDLRLYVLVTGKDPLKIYFFDDSFARVATEIYDLDLNNIKNKYKHFTNTAINKKIKIKKKTKFIFSFKRNQKIY